MDDFDQWKKEFISINEDFDVIYLPTNGAIKGWDDESGRMFVLENTKIVTFTCDDFMVDYAVFGLTKIAEEQGEWVAEAILRIIKGKPIENIPIGRNTKYNKLVNKELANNNRFSPM